MRLLLINILVLLITVVSFGQKKTTMKPVINKQAVRIVSGKQHVYYALKTAGYIDVSINDFDKLVVYSRERINKQPLGYTISYRFNNKPAHQYVVDSKKRDYRATFLNKHIAKNTSYLNKQVIQVPLGVSSVRFTLKSLTSVDIKIGVFKNNKLRFLKLQNATKVKLITGKAHKYYKLNSKTPTVIETVKEGELIVYTRIRLAEKLAKNYTFTYQIGDSIFKKVRINKVNKSFKAVYRSLGLKQTPSTYNKTIIKVNDVYQKIIFSSNFPVDARFVFKKVTKKNGWEELESKKGKVVPLIVKNKKTVKDYTRIELGQPFVFNIQNTEEIKIFIRGEFQYDMHANNDYEIVLRDNNKIVNTYKISCHRSNIMQYQFNNVLIPGTLDKFIIKVPLGKHKYSISINNKNKTALIRVMKKEKSELTFIKSVN